VGQPYAPKSVDLCHVLVGATKKTLGMCRGAPKISENHFLFHKGPDSTYFPIQFPIQRVPGVSFDRGKVVFA
jgi:hypothetical protein